MKPIVFVWIIFGAASLQAQNKADLRYFDQYWNPVQTKQYASYYRKIKDADSVYRVTDYFMNDSIYMDGFFSTVSPNLIHHGKATWFFKDGTVHRIGYFRKGKPVGIHKEYYPNGMLKSEILYDPKTEFHLNEYDDQGNSLLVDGTGIFRSSYFDEEYYNEVFDQQLLRSYFVNPVGDTIYRVATKPALYLKGGTAQFNKNLREWVRYPASHKKLGTEGTVMVSFIIDPVGNMTNVRVVKSLGPDFDPIALNVVKRNRDWRPASYRGQPVPMRFVVPVVFLHRLPDWAGNYWNSGPTFYGGGW